MAALTNTQKAQLLVDGSPINADTPGVASSDTAIATLVADELGKYEVVGIAPGTATITASYNGRSGSLEVTVSAEPFVLTLGPVEPR